MSDTGDLLAVMGELDRALVRLHEDDPEAGEQARKDAATLIPALGDPRTLGWYDRFLDATGARPPHTSLDGALRSLAAPTGSRAMVARRLVAIGAVARALPEFRPEGGRSEAMRMALSGPGILEGAPSVGERFEPPEEPAPRAGEMHERLMDRLALPDVRSLRTFLESERDNGLVHRELPTVAQPCTSRVVPVAMPGGTEIALAIVSEVCVGGTTFDPATADDATLEGTLLNPVNWAHSSFWCHIAPEGAAPWNGPRRFLEHVDLDCELEIFPVKVWLDFTAVHVDPVRKIAVREYSMSAAGQPSPANGQVTIDEGVLVVRREGTDVRVTTTKRVEFTAGLDEPALAVLACALGYGALAAEFALTGLGDDAHDLDCTGAPTSTVAPPRGQAAVGALDESISGLAATADECATAAADGLRRAATGDLTFAGLAQDLALSLRRVATAVGQVASIVPVLADPPRVLERVEAGPFELDTGSGVTAAAVPACRLELRNPLKSSRLDLPVASVGFASGGRDLGPGNVLDPGSLPFSLRVRAAGTGSGLYRGEVHLVEGPGSPPRTVPVEVLIP